MGRRSVAGMLKLEASIVSRLVCRFRSRAVVELENLALRHQLHVLRRQRPGRPRLFAIDRLLWAWLYRLWPRCLDAMVLVKPATVVQWHRQGFRLFWRWRSRSGRPSVNREVRKLPKETAAARGVVSPDRAEALMLALDEAPRLYEFLSIHDASRPQKLGKQARIDAADDAREDARRRGFGFPRLGAEGTRIIEPAEVQAS
jgi:hypothetical protein